MLGGCEQLLSHPHRAHQPAALAARADFDFSFHELFGFLLLRSRPARVLPSPLKEGWGQETSGARRPVMIWGGSPRPFIVGGTGTRVYGQYRRTVHLRASIPFRAGLRTRAHSTPALASQRRGDRISPTRFPEKRPADGHLPWRQPPGKPIAKWCPGGTPGGGRCGSIRSGDIPEKSPTSHG